MTGRKCPGLHCPGCGDGDGLGLIAVVVGLAVIGAVLHAIWRTLVEAAEIAALGVVSTTGLAAVAGIAYLVYRVRQNRPRQDRPRRPIAARAVYRLPPETGPRLEGSHTPALEPSRVQVWLTPDQLAAVVTRRDDNIKEDR